MSTSLHMNAEGLTRAAKPWAVSVLVVCIVAAALAWTFRCSDCERTPSRGGPSAAPALIKPAAVVPPPPISTSAVADAATPLRSLAAIENALFVKGSLRGTEAPPWGVGRDQPLKPNRALRNRFDYCLLALSEASLPELTAMIQAQAQRDLGTATAREVMEVWDRYLKLQQHPFQVAANLGDPMSMQAALQEHRQVRQSLLGVHWATAFYADEEERLQTEMESALTGAPPQRSNVEAALMSSPQPGSDLEALQQQRTQHFGPEAAQRLAALDHEHAEWDRRIESARAKVQALKGAQELSETQRTAAIKQVLDTAFPDPTEQLRAGGLVGD